MVGIPDARARHVTMPLRDALVHMFYKIQSKRYQLFLSENKTQQYNTNTKQKQ